MVVIFDGQESLNLKKTGSPIALCLQARVGHERVQKRAMRMVCDTGAMSYENKLTRLGIQSLEDRRRRGDAIEIFKTLKGFNNVDPTSWFNFVQDRHTINTRSYSDNLLVPEKTRLNIRHDFFTNRAVSIWNGLPEELRSAVSVNSFKNRYDELFIPS